MVSDSDSDFDQNEPESDEDIGSSLDSEQGCSQRGTHNHAVPNRDFFMERRTE